VGADGQELDHRRLVQGDALGLAPRSLRHGQIFAMPPSRCTPSTWMFMQQLGLPFRQAAQVPHDM
jgi:hypothetical protein